MRCHNPTARRQTVLPCRLSPQKTLRPPNDDAAAVTVSHRFVAIPISVGFAVRGASTQPRCGRTASHLCDDQARSLKWEPNRFMDRAAAHHRIRAVKSSKSTPSSSGWDFTPNNLAREPRQRETRNQAHPTQGVPLARSGHLRSVSNHAQNEQREQFDAGIRCEQGRRTTPAVEIQRKSFAGVRGIEALSLAMLVAGMPGSSRARDNDVPIGASGKPIWAEHAE